ncbi:MAG TPA: hypothetical protein VHU23_08280 [Rhizomicrobium sp.]|jgi:hypothetical protein|nr:hypothetical protein [Rhizomicrobium sp.]
MQNRIIRAAILAACVALCACSDDKIDQCPSVSTLVDTATLPVFQTSGSAMAYSVHITRATRDCDIHKFDKQVVSSVNINFRAVRAQAGAAATYTVPYYVAVSTEGRVLTKHVYSIQFTFEAGQAVAEFSQSLDSITLTVGQDKKAAEYGILVGFQLTKPQLEYNRRAGRYAP